MKRNKFIYMIVFSLVFLGFTGGVNASGCCYKDSNGKHIFVNNGQTSAYACQKTYNDSTAISTIDELTCQLKDEACCTGNGTYNSSDRSACSHGSASARGTWESIEACYKNFNICVSDSTGQIITSVGNDSTACRNVGGTIVTKYHYITNTKPESASSGQPSGSYSNGNGGDSGNNTTPTNNDPSDPDNSKAGNDGISGKSGTTGDETITIGFNCEDPSIASIVKTAKTVYNLLRYSVPVILIIMGSIDFLRATIAGKDDEIEKHKKTFINRLFLAVIIFMLLSIFQLTTNLLEHAGVSNSNTWYECWNHINDE